MENRFTFKDFVFAVLLVVLIGLTGLAIWQYSYQEQRVIDLTHEVKKLGDLQREQLTVLDNLNRTLRSGVHVSATSEAADTQPVGVIRRKTPGGGEYVYYPRAPRAPHDPHDLPGYASGDWEVRNLGSEPAVVTPFIDRDAYGSAVQGPVLETLLNRNPETLDWEPFLAESYEILPDKLTYRFKLRDDIKFSDGSPVTMDDVLFSYNTAMMPGVDADSIQSYLNKIDKITKVDARTLEVKLKEPYFMGLEVAGAFVSIIPEKIYRFKTPEEYNKRTDLLVGTGPYVFEARNWVKGQQITLVRNDNYWGERPTFDRLVFRFIPNPQAALQGLQDGQIDFMSPQPDQYVKFSSNPEFTKRFETYAFKVPNSGYRYIGYNLRKPMFKDKLTRQAMTELIDRDAINHNIGKDLWYTVTGPFPPMVQQADPTVKPWPYDPEDAKKKLAAAGWKLNDRGVLERDGQEFRFDLMIPSQNAVTEAIASYVKEQFRKVGIDVTVAPFEFSVMVDRLDNRNFDAAMLGWTGSIEGDPYQIWDSSQIAGKGSNFIGFDNKEADRLIETARRELDTDKRMELWHKFHRLIAEEQPYTFLSAGMQTAFIDNRFANTKPYKTGLEPLDWYVPAAKRKYR